MNGSNKCDFKFYLKPNSLITIFESKLMSWSWIPLTTKPCLMIGRGIGIRKKKRNDNNALSNDFKYFLFKKKSF